MNRYSVHPRELLQIKRPNDPDLDDDVIEASKRPREQEKTLSFSLALLVCDVFTVSELFVHSHIIG